MRRAAFAIALAAVAVAGPAAAQSKQLSWALTNCLKNVKDLRVAQKAVAAAGYRYEPEDYGGGPQDILHWYVSPDGAVTVAFAYGSTHDGSSCQIIPKGVTVGQAVPYARSAATQLLGVSLNEGSPRGGGNKACDAWAKYAGLTVRVDGGSEGQDPMCLAGEPAQIMINVTKG